MLTCHLIRPLSTESLATRSFPGREVWNSGRPKQEGRTQTTGQRFSAQACSGDAGHGNPDGALMVPIDRVLTPPLEDESEIPHAVREEEQLVPATRTAATGTNTYVVAVELDGGRSTRGVSS